MIIGLRSSRSQTAARVARLRAYMDQHVMTDADFLCDCEQRCYGSVREEVGQAAQFTKGQLHHIGRHYDLFADGRELRIVVTGQEYGGLYPLITLEKRRRDIIRSAEKGWGGRNPHMRGTTTALRLLLGASAGTDDDGEQVQLENERAHIFEAFALVNFLLCSATSAGTGNRGRSTSEMRSNCARHYRESLAILEPSVVVTQGYRFWESAAGVCDGGLSALHRLREHVHEGRLVGRRVIFVRLSHPSSLGATNWGRSHNTEYVRGVVEPVLSFARRAVLGG